MIIKKTKLFVALLEISLIKFDLITKIITKKNKSVNKRKQKKQQKQKANAKLIKHY